MVLFPGLKKNSPVTIGMLWHEDNILNLYASHTQSVMAVKNCGVNNTSSQPKTRDVS